MSLVKTRLRAARRGEIPSTVGVRQPNPYENVHLCLEFAIYQTHVKFNGYLVSNLKIMFESIENVQIVCEKQAYIAGDRPRPEGRGFYKKNCRSICVINKGRFLAKDLHLLLQGLLPQPHTEVSICF